MVDTIKDLARLSKTINDKSDSFSATISDLNSQLAALNLGVEVWLDHALRVSPYHREYADHDGHLVREHRDAVVLGYAKVLDEWQLAVREAEWETESDEYGNKSIKETDPVDRPLLQASRNIRIQAAGLLPKLLAAIKQEAEAMVKHLDEAEKAAASVRH